MSAIEIRKAGADDLPMVFRLVAALLKELGEEGEEAGELNVNALSGLQRQLGDRYIALLAMTGSGIPAGVLTLSESFAIYANGRFGVINEMYVVPEYRDTRIGVSLISAAVSHGQRCGWHRIDVTAPEAERWRGVRHFYEQNGFAYAGPKLKRLL